MFADSSASQDLLMRRRELKDRACKDKARSDSGFYRASSSSSASSLLPNKLSLERTSKSQVVSAYSNSVCKEGSFGSLSSGSTYAKPAVLTDQLFRNHGVLSEKSDNLSDMDECSEFGDTQGVARDNLSNDTVIEEIDPPPPNNSDDDDSDNGGCGDIPADGNGDMFNKFMQSFCQAMSSMGPPVVHSRESPTAELNRQITALAPHKDGIDITKYIRKLEADLSDLGCPRRTRFKTILLQKLQSKAGTSLVATLDRDEVSYSELK